MTNPDSPAARSRTRLKVGFLLADRFTLSAFANFVDVLRLAADEADRSRPILCDWAVLSEDMNPVRSSCGVKVQPDQRLRNAGHFDYIAVVGGLIGTIPAFGRETVDFLQSRAKSGVPMIGLCTGVFLLHEIGLLDGYRCCVSWFHHEEFVARFAGARPVSDQIFVVDRDRLTCSGGQSTAHLAAFLVDRHVGQTAMAKSLSILIIDRPMNGERPQPGSPARPDAKDPLVRKALIRMQQVIGAPETVGELAAWLKVSRRSLERRFREDLGATPSRVGFELRLAQARKLLDTTESSVTQIALETGFCDAPHLIRAFKSETGLTPAAYRSLHHASQDMDRRPAVSPD